MRRTKFASIISILALIWATGCSDNETHNPSNPPEDDAPIGPGEEIVLDTSKSINSWSGCMIDADCTNGAFCFQGQCVVQCNESMTCDSGYACQLSRGRCVNESFLQNIAEALKMDTPESPMSPQEKAMILAELDLQAAQNSDVRYSVLGKKNEAGEKIQNVEFIKRLPYEIHRENAKTGLSFEVRNSVGPVFYAVKTSENSLPVLKKVKGIRTANGSYQYTLDVNADEAVRSLKHLQRDGGELDTVELDIVTSVGNESVLLSETPSISRIYSGKVVPFSVLSGIDLPIRMAIEVFPDDVHNFDEIQSIKLYLPVSDTDIFSPENVKSTDTITEWTSVNIAQKDNASNCTNGKACFAAVFSTNDFVSAGSMILSKDDHVNRSIRLEIDSFDAENTTFSGIITDKFEGFFRESASSNISNEQQQWNVTQLGGYFKVVGTSLLPEDLKSHNHAAENLKMRDISEASIQICSGDDVSALMKYIKTSWTEGCNGLEENDALLCQKYQTCKNVDNLASYEALSLDDRLFCVQAAVNEILLDKTRVSYVLEQVLVSDASGKENTEEIEVCGRKINNFEDFRTACADSNCNLCKERPELSCASDLLAKLYKENKLLDSDAKSSLASSWINMMKESYIAQQYLAWNQDTEIRKSWLTGASYSGTFAAATMNSHNKTLLKRYQSEVLDVQRSVLRKQFVQSTLEMLSHSTADADATNVNEFSSLRNRILSDLSSCWESAASSLGLAAKRYDVLIQNDSERLSAAAELRPVLFDLYFSGLIASTINLKADQGSLNGAFGANLSSAIGKLSSLDQPFENLVFSRDGEIFTDTRLETDSDETALGRVKSAAESSTKKAEQKRTDVFNAINAQNQEILTIKDGYMSSLENMRTQIVNLCGYPSDCSTSEQRKTCQLFTAPFFCGLAIPSTDTTGVDLSKFESSTHELAQASISQVSDLNNCLEKYSHYEDGTLSEMSETDIHSCFGYDLNDISLALSTDVEGNISKAGLAIQELRQAILEYETSRAEYQIHLQKVNNTYETLNAYAESLSEQFTNMADTLSAIENNLTTIKQYESAIANYQIKINDEKTSALKAEYHNKVADLAHWAFVQGVGGIFNGVYSVQALKKAFNMMESEMSHRGDELERDAAAMNSRTSSALMDYIGFTTAIDAISRASINYYTFNPAAPQIVVQGYGSVVDVAAQIGTFIDLSIELSDKFIFSKKAALATNANELVKSTFNLATGALNKGMSISAANTQAELAETISKLKSAVTLHKEQCEGNSSAACTESQSLSSDEMTNLIADLERQNQLLLKQIEYENERNHALEELELGRNALLNDTLDLLDFERMVYIKDLDVAQKHLEYLKIAQDASELAMQFNNKLARFNTYRDLMGSASSFFQYAADLEDVEKYMEYARNDLSDYLAAIEYLTVRPFVDLRRSIYTARGTNDLNMIYKQLNDLTNRCGSGTRSQNQIKLSVRNRLGLVDDEFGGISAENKMMLNTRSGQITSDAELRYVKNEELSNLISNGKYLSSSFSLTPKLANISNSCDAKIDEIQVRLVSMEGKALRESANSTPKIILIYGGQSQLMSCHDKIDAIASSIGTRTTYGKYSTFHSDPISGGLNAGVYEVQAGEKYALSDRTEFTGTTSYLALRGYPLMATYSIMIDPESGENPNIHWENLADIEIQISYSTGTLGSDSSVCNYDL